MTAKLANVAWGCGVVHCSFMNSDVILISIARWICDVYYIIMMMMY